MVGYKETKLFLVTVDVTLYAERLKEYKDMSYTFTREFVSLLDKKFNIQRSIATNRKCDFSTLPFIIACVKNMLNLGIIQQKIYKAFVNNVTKLLEVK